MDARIRLGRATWVVAGIASLLGLATAGGCYDYRNGYGYRHHGRGIGNGGYAGAGGNGGVNASCPGGSTSNFHVAWTIQDASGAPSSCDKVDATEMDLDLLNLDTHTDYHAVFACSAMAGATCALPPGSYSVAMRLRDANGTVLSELLAPTPISITAGQTTDLGVIPFASAQGKPAAGTGGAGGGAGGAAGGNGGSAGGGGGTAGNDGGAGGAAGSAGGSDGGAAGAAGGSDGGAAGAAGGAGGGGNGGNGGTTGNPPQGLSLSWTIDRNGTTLSCAQASAATVQVDDGSQQFNFACGDGHDTAYLAAGSYPVTIRLLDASGTALSLTSTMTVVVPAGTVINLGSVLFEVL